MKMTLTNMLILFTSCAGVYAQVAPAATGPGAPSISGNLHYTLRYSQTAEFGSSVGDWQTTSASASADYANGKERLPFAMNYSGGYTWTITGPSYATGLFQVLSLSQGFIWRKWSVTFSDDASYRPQAPTTGFSGIPGIGEPIGEPVPSPPSGQSILTLNTHVVNNLANGEFEHNLNYALILSAGGGGNLLRYPDGNGLDTNTLMANAGLVWRFNARNSVSGRYMFSQFSYPDHNFSFVSNSPMFGFTREWNRRITTDVSAGPQWTSSSDSATVPSSLGVAVNAAIDYQSRFTGASLTYNRETNGGGGYLFGSESDAAHVGCSRNFGKNLTIGLDGSYMRTSGLLNNGVTNAKYGGAQATRRLGRYLTVYANYTATAQSTSSLFPANTLSGLMQVVGFGIGYSSRETHLKQ